MDFSTGANGAAGTAGAAGLETGAVGAKAAGDGTRRDVSDGVGMILLGLCAAWALCTAAAHDGRPEGVLLAVLAAAAGCAAGRISGTLLPVAAPCAGAVAGVVLAVTMPALPTGDPYQAPLGHAGASAALLALATGAVCCAARSASAPVLRAVLFVLAAGIVPTGAAVGSPGGCAAAAAVLLCSVAAGSMPCRGAGVVGLGVAAVAVAGGVGAVAAGGLAGTVTERIGPYRTGLWREALRLAGRAPLSGTGPGGLDGAGGRPHSAPLQLAAEQGVIGALLPAALFCWVLYALWRSPRPAPVVLTAGAALTAVAITATVSDALSFTTVTAGAGLLTGWATARPWTSQEAGVRRETGAGERAVV